MTQEQEDILRNLLRDVIDVRKYSFCVRVVNIWNSLSLPNQVITATSVNSFKNRLDLFGADQEVLYNYKANITGNRGIKL